MKTKLLLMMVFAASVLACGIATDLPEPKVLEGSVISQPTHSGLYEYQAVGTAYIRSCPQLSCPVVGHIEAGGKALAECDQKWCRLEDGNYVRAACLGFGSGKCWSK